MSLPSKAAKAIQWQQVIYHRGKPIALVKVNLEMRVEIVSLADDVTAQTVEDSLRAAATDHDANRRHAKATQ